MHILGKDKKKVLTIGISNEIFQYRPDLFQDKLIYSFIQHDDYTIDWTVFAELSNRPVRVKLVRNILSNVYTTVPGTIYLSYQHRRRVGITQWGFTALWEYLLWKTQNVRSMRCRFTRKIHANLSLKIRLNNYWNDKMNTIVANTTYWICNTNLSARVVSVEIFTNISHHKCTKHDHY